MLLNQLWEVAMQLIEENRIIIKTVVIDAGHGGPDEGDFELKL